MPQKCMVVIFDIKDLTPVPRAKDKVGVDQGTRGFGTIILITHVYIIP